MYPARYWLLDAADAFKPHFLDKPILKSLVCTPNATFSLRAVGTYQLNSKLSQNPTELSRASRGRPTVVDSENAMFITIKRQWFTVLSEVLASGHHVIESRLSLTKTKVHQAASSIINKNEKAAFGGASFKPVMRGTIDLNKFSEAVTPVSRLMNTWPATRVWDPESISRHPFSERFNRHRDVMAFAQFFCGKRWSKVAVVIVK